MNPFTITGTTTCVFGQGVKVPIEVIGALTDQADRGNNKRAAMKVNVRNNPGTFCFIMLLVDQYDAFKISLFIFQDAIVDSVG